MPLLLIPLATMLESFLQHFTYFALMFILIIASFGVPIPEDIPLVTGGYLCNKDYSPIAIANKEDADHDGIPDHKKHVPHLWLMIAAGMLGVLIGDSLVFSIGRQGIDGDNMIAKHLRKVLHSKRREKVERHFAKHGNLTVFAGRFMPGFRSIVFAFAGMSKMSFPRFLLIDFIAAGISVPLFTLLGYYFAGTVQEMLEFIARVKHFVIPIVILAGLVAFWIYLRRRRARQQAVVEQI